MTVHRIAPTSSQCFIAAGDVHSQAQHRPLVEQLRVVVGDGPHVSLGELESFLDFLPLRHVVGTDPHLPAREGRRTPDQVRRLEDGGPPPRRPRRER